VHKPCSARPLRNNSNDIEVDMPKVWGIKHNSEESSTSPATSPNMEVSFDGELCVKCNEPVTAGFLKCIWCERWQHSRCIKISPEKFSNLRNSPINIAFFVAA